MKKILILGLGAFGFAIARHLGKNNHEQIFHASEVNTEIFDVIQKDRKHPYFFDGATLPDNIKLCSDIDSLLPEVDIIISVIPCQFLGEAFADMKDRLKDWVTILNLSKWINNNTLQTSSEKLEEVLKWVNYTYAYLAWGMIAQEVVDGKTLGADIVTPDKDVGEDLRNLFASESLDIHLIIGNPKNTELYAALKNIIALILGYYEGQWNGASTLGYYLTQLLEEVSCIIEKLWGNPDLNFTDYALGWDIIATCFWGSRNKLLGNMLWEWKDIQIALQELAEQKKIAEWYETLKWVYKITKGKSDFLLINTFSEKFLA